MMRAVGCTEHIGVTFKGYMAFVWRYFGIMEKNMETTKLHLSPAPMVLHRLGAIAGTAKMPRVLKRCCTCKAVT